MVGKQLIDTANNKLATDLVSMWLTSKDDANNHFMTKDKILEEVTKKNENKKGMGEKWQLFKQTLHNAAIPINWAEENDFSACGSFM